MATDLDPNNRALPTARATHEPIQQAVSAVPVGVPNAIAIRCPQCKFTITGERCQTDPKRAAVMEIICPSCDDGDRHEPRFFSENGEEVPWHEGLER
jgi:hypothetical protein